MISHDDPTRHPSLSWLALLAILLPTDTICAGDAIVVARAAALPPFVVQAVRDAADRLAGPACQEVFSDFRDAAGRTLRQNLDALGLTPAAYLQWTLFYDGRGRLACESPWTMATTSRGSRAIYVCTAQFTALAQHQPGLAANLIIHEELHSLGLGESPPDAAAITARVIARCGK